MIEMTVYSIKFMRSHLFHCAQEVQKGIVGLVFEGIQRWQELVTLEHSLGQPMFQAISSLFEEVIKSWSVKLVPKSRGRMDPFMHLAQREKWHMRRPCKQEEIKHSSGIGPSDDSEYDGECDFSYFSDAAAHMNMDG
jgi:hypothetical protein